MQTSLFEQRPKVLRVEPSGQGRRSWLAGGGMRNQSKCTLNGEGYCVNNTTQ